MLELLLWGTIGVLFHFVSKLLNVLKKQGKDFQFSIFINNHIYNVMLSLVLVVGAAMYPVQSWDLLVQFLSFLTIDFVQINVSLFVVLPPSLFAIGYMGDSIMRKVIGLVRGIFEKIKK